jgi:hypothetical protein
MGGTYSKTANAFGRISKISYESEKIDQRLDFPGVGRNYLRSFPDIVC